LCSATGRAGAELVAGTPIADGERDHQADRRDDENVKLPDRGMRDPDAEVRIEHLRSVRQRAREHGDVGEVTKPAAVRNGAVCVDADIRALHDPLGPGLRALLRD
jgi:hypothetical protein